MKNGGSDFLFITPAANTKTDFMGTQKSAHAMRFFYASN